MVDTSGEERRGDEWAGLVCPLPVSEPSPSSLRYKEGGGGWGGGCMGLKKKLYDSTSKGFVAALWGQRDLVFKEK